MARIPDDVGLFALGWGVKVAEGPPRGPGVPRSSWLSDGYEEETPGDERRLGLAEVLLGLDGFRVLAVTEASDELTRVITHR